MRLFGTPLVSLHLEPANLGAEEAWWCRQVRPDRSLAWCAAHSQEPLAWLIRGELDQLSLEDDAGQTLCRRAFHAFEASEDLAAASDCLGPLALQEFSLGRSTAAQTLMEQAQHLAQAAGDRERVACARATLGVWWIFQDLGRSKACLESLQDEYGTPSGAAWTPQVLQLEGKILVQAGQYGPGAQVLSQAFDAAVAQGQIRVAHNVAATLAFCFDNLLDNDFALQWMERGVALLTHHPWPTQQAQGYFQTGRSLLKLGHLDQAETVFLQALELGPRGHQGRNASQVLWGLGTLALDTGRLSEGLDYLQRLRTNALAAGHRDMEAVALYGLARGHSLAGRPREALPIVQEARTLATACGHRSCELESLQLMAKVLLAEDTAEAVAAAEKTLFEAWGISHQTDSIELSGDLFGLMARLKADQGQFQEAWEWSARALEVSDLRAARIGARQVLAQQARFHSEALYRENQKLQDSLETLATLEAVGREITAELFADSLFQKLASHLRSLFAVDGYGIFSLDEGPGRLVCRYAVEGNQVLSLAPLPLDSPESFTARCARTREVVNADRTRDGAAQTQIPGTLVMESLLFVPLLVGDRLVGVLSLQSTQREHFDTRRVLLARSLGSHLAIALDNALAYRRLQELKARLSERELLASMGSLANGLAHQLNTPLGNAILSLSSLEPLLGADQVRARQFLALTSSGLQRLRLLVDGFKKLSGNELDRELGPFTLDQALREATVLSSPTLGPRNVAVVPGAHLDTTMFHYRSVLREVLIQLVENAAVHAYGPEGGRVDVWFEREGTDRGVLHVADYGQGLDEEVAARAFEPFFSGHRPTQRSGLGLSIAQSYTELILRGTLALETGPGRGCDCVLRLPLHHAS